MLLSVGPSSKRMKIQNKLINDKDDNISHTEAVLSPNSKAGYDEGQISQKEPDIYEENFDTEDYQKIASD